MINQTIIASAMYESMRSAVTKLPEDVASALDAALREETGQLARMHLETFFKNAKLALDGKGLICGDTGFPIYFIKIRNDTKVQGGVSAIIEAARETTARLTSESFLRPTMVDPLTRENPGDNTGPGMPIVDISFSDDIEGIEIIAAPKGGGSEIFGTFYRMLFPSDGIQGVKTFIIDCIKASCYAGKICPPAIVGVGIGGTSDLCMSIAKKAALLRKVGSRNTNPSIAELEEEILKGSRKLGIGPMGSKGINAVLALHIETAHTHTAALPVAFNAQCLIGRRWKAIISNENKIKYTGEL